MINSQHPQATDRDTDEQRHAVESLQHQLQHLRSLIAVLADWSWVQDSAYRFTQHFGTQVAAEAGAPSVAHLGDSLGQCLWEVPGVEPLSMSWAAHRAVLEARQPFQDFEFSWVLGEDPPRYFSVSGVPVFHSQRQFTGYLGLSRNITSFRQDHAAKQDALRVPLAEGNGAVNCRSLAEQEIAQGNFCGYYGVGVDISARRQAETALRANEARHRAVVAALAEGVILRDADGRIIDCNASAERFYGRTLDQLKGLTSIVPDWEILCEDGSPMAEETWPSVVARRTGLPQSDVVIGYRKPDSSECWVLVNLQPLFEGATRTPSGYVSTITDVTERKRAQLEITNLNVELENRVQRRTAQLEAANAALEAFSYSVAHDLRAPLSTIKGFSALLKKEILFESGGRAHHYLDRILSGVRQMGELTDGLLSLAHLSRTSLSRAPVDLSAEAAQILMLCLENETGRVVRTKVDAGMRVLADPVLLRQVLDNLISNAWKFTSKNPAAEISVGQGVGSGGQPVYFVRDNGVGFDMAYVDKLFGAFQRLHRDEEFPGSGVGLATVQRIIERHGGKVWARSVLDQGCTFFFTLGGEQARAGQWASATVEDTR